MQSIPITLVTPLSALITEAVSTIRRLVERQHCLVITLSGGKDSSTTALLCLEAIRQVSRAGLPQARHFVSSSSTGVENPEIENNLLRIHDDIAAWVATEGLLVDVRTVAPSLAAKFVASTIGRGTLPRFVENGAKRACSYSWKALPQERLAKQLRDESLAGGYRETVTILGTRLDESQARRAAMRRRGDQANEPVRNDSGFLTLSPIAAWTEAQVWEFLASFMSDANGQFPSFASAGCIPRMLDLYRSANEGTCGMFMDDGRKAPCGSRFGCWQCTITGERDKSMESMLAADPRFGYMQGLNDFRNFLIATQWDMSKRERTERTISAVGYVSVQPDVYNLRMRRDLFRYLLTLDELERERAEGVDGALVTGELPSTPENERMRYPQFEIVSIEDAVLVDFYWSMNHSAGHAFPALSDWYDIKVLGRRYPIPKVAATARVSIPQKRWFKVGAFDHDAPADGLRDYLAEQWNPYLHPERPLAWREVGGERVAWFEEGEGLEVDAAAAAAVLDTYCTTPMAIEAGGHHAMESARFWLNEEVVKLPSGMAARYQHMAKRGQYFCHLMQRLNITPAQLDDHLLRCSISEEDHNKLLAAHERASRAAQPQQELFAA